MPGLVARILSGTGRVNVGQGAVMTVQGLGAALSPALGGWIAQEIGLRHHVSGAWKLSPWARSRCGSASRRSLSPGLCRGRVNRQAGRLQLCAVGSRN